MMGIHKPQKELCSYEVDLDRRVRTDHPLRRLNCVLDLSFVRAEVARCYGFNGHVSVDPVVLVKLMYPVDEPRLFVADQVVMN
jgi:transposase